MRSRCILSWNVGWRCSLVSWSLSHDVLLSEYWWMVKLATLKVLWAALSRTSLSRNPFSDSRQTSKGPAWWMKFLILSWFYCRLESSISFAEASQTGVLGLPVSPKVQAGNFQGSSKCHMSIFDLEDFIIFRNAMDSTAPDVSTGVWISSNLRSHQRLRNPPHSLIQSTTESTLTLRYGHWTMPSGRRMAHHARYSLSILLHRNPIYPSQRMLPESWELWDIQESSKYWMSLKTKHISTLRLRK